MLFQFIWAVGVGESPSTSSKSPACTGLLADALVPLEEHGRAVFPRLDALDFNPRVAVPHLDVDFRRDPDLVALNLEYLEGWTRCATLPAAASLRILASLVFMLLPLAGPFIALAPRRLRYF